MPRLARDERALATAIIIFFGILALTALLYALVNPVFEQSQSMLSNQTTSQQAQGVIDARMQVWDYILLFPLFAAGIMLIVRAVFESRGGR